MQWALAEAVPEDGWRRRSVTYNPSIRYSTRLWPDLGVDLYIVKLRATLPKLIAEAGSYATGKVRGLLQPFACFLSAHVFGVGLYIVKLQATLPKLIGKAGSCAIGKVRGLL